jgi:hypothetical protein
MNKDQAAIVQSTQLIVCRNATRGRRPRSDAFEPPFIPSFILPLPRDLAHVPRGASLLFLLPPFLSFPMFTTTYSLAALLLLAASLLLPVDAQLSYPSCEPSWSWVRKHAPPRCLGQDRRRRSITNPFDAPSPQSFNSLGQSPCAVAAYLQSVCDNGGEAHD